MPPLEPLEEFETKDLEDPIRIVVADSVVIRAQLLARALRSRKQFTVSTVSCDAGALHNHLVSKNVDIILVDGHEPANMSLLRWLHVSHPEVATVLLAEQCDEQTVVETFRAGAKGIFLFDRSPFRLLCKCLHCVSKGQIWINTEQMRCVLSALSEVPALRVVNASGRALLTPREEQVVALVSDGLSNREVARELGLSEHTIKKYLLRIFDKLGISTRVELVLYAMSHGENRPAEWLAAHPC